MHQLFDTSLGALKFSSAIRTSLSGMDTRLGSIDGTLSRVDLQQKELAAVAQDSLAQIKEARNQLASIQGGLHAVHQAGVRTLRTV